MTIWDYFDAYLTSKPEENGGDPLNFDSESKQQLIRFGSFILNFDRKGDMPPAPRDLELYASKIGLPPFEVKKFQMHYGSTGWMVGKHKMKSWRHALEGWKIRWEEAGRPMPKHTAAKNWNQGDKFIKQAERL